jgi:hypothetical protein
MHHKLVLSSAFALVTLGLAAGAYASMTSGAPRMGPVSTVRREAFRGYYDGHKDTYVNTDVSDKKEAAMMHVNYAPVLKTVPLNTAPEIYLVQGKAVPGQLAIFGSEPGEPTYSPIWKETILTWKASASPVLITSDTQVDQLEHKGELSERATSVRLNCPIIKVAKA